MVKKMKQGLAQMGRTAFRLEYHSVEHKGKPKPGQLRSELTLCRQTSPYTEFRDGY